MSVWQPHLQEARRAAGGSRLTERGAAIGLLVLCFGLMMFAFLDGMGPRDAERYIRAALVWAEEGPTLGETHWALRYPIVLPVAAAFRLFGPSEIAASAVCAAFVAGLVAVTFIYGRRHLGRRAGTLAALFTATSAFLAAQAFEVRIYAPEMFLAAWGAWLLVEGLKTGSVRRLYLAGLLAGGAWLCRETAVFLPVVFGLVSFYAFRFRLVPLLASSAGFLTVLAAELAAYWLIAGDPLYRLTISSGHEVINAGGEAPEAVAVPVATPLQGNPLIELLTTPNVTPFLLAALLLALLAPRRVFAPLSPVALVFGGGAALSYLISSFALRLEEALYTPILPYAAVLLCAVALGHARPRIGKSGVAAASVGLIAASLAAADFRDYDEYAEARHLARLLESDALAGERVATDPVNANRTQLLLDLGDGKDGAQAARVYGTEEPCAGALAFTGRPKGQTGGLRPGPDWALLSEAEIRRVSWTRSLVRRVPESVLPGKIVQVTAEPEPVRLYRVGPSSRPCRAEDGVFSD
ncbi:glycosyltransferase family 39 protein [Parvularcula oceani]|uniref:glycosyltransferase family 39 protein n=1 Tax=Parvularcula oceani TaxID=1247963 RepID=UPI0004E1DB21|nr:glycosyltransferase family 39 protein [Parvularcula oceani]